MILTGNEQKDNTMKLLPHQNALLETFFDPASKRFILLRGDVGMGKSAALAALVGRLLREEQMARILFLVPATLRIQFFDMLHNMDCPAMIVDRYRFRELLDASAENDFWPKGVALILSIDFAKQTDIQFSLAKVPWDLVIVDEAHMAVRGARAEILQKVVSFANRVILATVISLDLPDIFPADEITMVEWRRHQIVDLNGKPLDMLMRPVLHEVPFKLSAVELQLRATIKELCSIFENGTPMQNFRTMKLIRSLESSPAALEGALRRLGNLLEMVQKDTHVQLSLFEDEELEDGLPEALDRTTVEKAFRTFNRALQEIDEIVNDSKLSAFSEILDHLEEENMPVRRICVLTEYMGTLYYLAAEIEGRGLQCQLLHGEMSTEERFRTQTVLSTGGKTLVATLAGIKAYDLSDITDLILYDIPRSKNALYVLLSHFNSVDRQNQLDIHVLTPSDSTGVLITEPHTTLRELITMGPDND